MELQIADYVLAGLTVILAVSGLFRGFSGTLAFIAACAAASFTGTFGWRFSTDLIASAPIRALAVLVVTLLVFGLVRVIVKKLVNGLLAQPADAIFGFLVGLISGALLVVAWAYSGFLLEYSNLATELAGYVR